MTARNETVRNLPVPLAGAAPGFDPRSAWPDAAFCAQALGQAGQRRGLKGGAPVLAAARAAYLRTQWSGEDDRRPLPGLVARGQL